MLEYECPKCGHELSSPDSLAGRSETCPECGHSVGVPEAREPEKDLPKIPKTEGKPLRGDANTIVYPDRGLVGKAVSREFVDFVQGSIIFSCVVCVLAGLVVIVISLDEPRLGPVAVIASIIFTFLSCLGLLILYLVIALLHEIACTLRQIGETNYRAKTNFETDNVRD